MEPSLVRSATSALKLSRISAVSAKSDSAAICSAVFRSFSPLCSKRKFKIGLI